MSRLAAQQGQVLFEFYRKYHSELPLIRSYLSTLSDCEHCARRGALVELPSALDLQAGSESVPVAILLFQDLGEVVEVLLTATTLSHRRQGLMKGLLVELSRLFPRHKLWLEVSENNFAAKSLYLALGFVSVGIRPDYYGPGESALLLSWPPPHLIV